MTGCINKNCCNCTGTCGYSTVLSDLDYTMSYNLTLPIMIYNDDVADIEFPISIEKSFNKKYHKKPNNIKKIKCISKVKINRKTNKTTKQPMAFKGWKGKR